MKIMNIDGKIIHIVEESDTEKHLTEEDLEMDRRAQAAVSAAINKARVCKKPVALYDSIRKKAYLEYPNGEREYV